MSPMKIALLSFEYPHETGFGGIGTYTWYQARALVKLGHEVHVLAGATERTLLRTEEHDGVRVHRYRSQGFSHHVVTLLNRKKLWWTSNRVENAKNMYQAWKLLDREHHFDVVEMPECGADGALINHMTSARTIMKFHSPSRLIMPLYDVKAADITLCSWIEKIGMWGAQAFSSCSKFLANEAHNKLGIRRPISVIPNGIDLALFDAAERVNVRKKFGLSPDRLIIFFSGRMEPRKGIHLCQDIATSILERYEVDFVFAGQDLFNYMSDTLLPYLNERTLKGAVHYLGKLDLTDIRSFLTQADIFLIPSLWENCPYSCLEAMASGCAVVSSDQGGMPELIRDGQNGLLTSNEHVDSYVANLQRLIEDQPLRERLGVAARQTIETRHTDLHIARQSLAYYANEACQELTIVGESLEVNRLGTKYAE